MDSVITDKYRLYHGDCLEVMKQFPDNSIDMILCDLPNSCLSELADIIVWNIFQMDGLTMCIPQMDVIKTKDKKFKAVDGIAVKVNNWKENKTEFFDNERNVVVNSEPKQLSLF